jgi:endonuclease IV
LEAASIFVGGPKNRNITLTPPERAELKRFVEATGVRVIAHSAYSAAPWSGDPDAARYIREELSVCAQSGIEGLVVHLPKRPVADVMRYIGRLVEPSAAGVRVYLETPAVKPSESYYETPAKLAALFREIRRELDPRSERFGLCVDTAHLWTCGVDVASRAAAESWLHDLEAEAADIPPEAVMIHLNDSKRERGVGPDAHEALCEGRIWERYARNLGASGLAAVVEYARRHGTPMILERKPNAALVRDYLLLRGLLPCSAGEDARLG